MQTSGRRRWRRASRVRGGWAAAALQPGLGVSHQAAGACWPPVCSSSCSKLVQRVQDWNCGAQPSPALPQQMRRPSGSAGPSTCACAASCGMSARGSATWASGGRTARWPRPCSATSSLPSSRACPTARWEGGGGMAGCGAHGWTSWLMHCHACTAAVHSMWCSQRCTCSQLPSTVPPPRNRS